MQGEAGVAGAGAGAGAEVATGGGEAQGSASASASAPPSNLQGADVAKDWLKAGLDLVAVDVASTSASTPTVMLSATPGLAGFHHPPNKAPAGQETLEAVSPQVIARLKSLVDKGGIGGLAWSSMGSALSAEEKREGKIASAAADTAAAAATTTPEDAMDIASTEGQEQQAQAGETNNARSSTDMERLRAEKVAEAAAWELVRTGLALRVVGLQEWRIVGSQWKKCWLSFDGSSSMSADGQGIDGSQDGDATDATDAAGATVATPQAVPWVRVGGVEVNEELVHRLRRAMVTTVLQRPGIDLRFLAQSDNLSLTPALSVLLLHELVAARVMECRTAKVGLSCIRP